MSSDAQRGRADTILLSLAAALLLITFISGGNSAKGSLGSMLAQLLAIPILIHALVLAHKRGRLGSARMGILVVALIVLLPLLQLLPLPSAIWNLSGERLALMQDIRAAGVTAVDQRWSLSPGATERDLFFLLPGLALFFCMLAAGRRIWGRMLWLLIGLSVANLILAFAQMGAGQHSILNPFPEFAPAMAGIFANRNHQASMLAVGLMLVAAFLLDAWKQARTNGESYAKVGTLVLLALMLILALPLIGSRAGVIVAMIMLMGVLLSSGLPSANVFRRNHLLQFGSVLALVVFAVGLYAALGWMKSDAAIEGSRYTMLIETLRIGAGHAPLGAGIGTFVPAFEQSASDALLMNAYINNAHNEYAQWWMEAGILGVLVPLLALFVLARTLLALLRQRTSERARKYGMAAMTGIGVIVLHSFVDYPLRTPALMSVFAVLSGIAVAAAGFESSARQPARRRHASASEHPRLGAQV
jgi:O-antigen ligase